MDGGVHFLQTSAAHDVLSVKSSYLQWLIQYLTFWQLKVC